jgi:pilus assembly protein CpaE
MPATSILVCAPDEQMRDELAEALRAAGHAVTAVATPAAAMAAIQDHHVDLVVADGLTVSSAVQALRMAATHGPTPVIVVAPADDVEARIAFIEAGADDVIASGFDPQEIDARVEAVLIRYGRRVPGADRSGNRRAEVIGFFSPKGGVGTTTLAVNTAVALAPTGSILLIDLDLDFGQVATHLNVVPRFDVAGLATDEQALNDPELAMTYLTSHSSGISVLAAPAEPAEAGVGPEQVERMIGLFRSRFDRIIVDCGSDLNRRVLPMLELADIHVFIIFPEIAALKALSSLLSFVRERATFSAQTVFVINHIFPKELLKVRDVENLIRAKPTAEVPYTEIDVVRSVNEGNPVVTSRPSSQAAVAMRRLADALVGVRIATARPEPARRRGLFRR